MEQKRKKVMKTDRDTRSTAPVHRTTEVRLHQKG